MGPFPELGADPFPRRRDNDRFRSRQVVAAALGVHLELPDALDFVESELDADRKIPVHREEVDDAAAAGEISRPAHRVLVAVARCRELRRNPRGGCVHPPPDADARLPKVVRCGCPAQRARGRGDDQGRVPRRGLSERGERHGAKRQHLGVGSDSRVGVRRGTRQPQDGTRFAERGQQHFEIGGCGEEVPVVSGQEEQRFWGFPRPGRHQRQPRKAEETADPPGSGIAACPDGGEKRFESGDHACLQRRVRFHRVRFHRVRAYRVRAHRVRAHRFVSGGGRPAPPSSASAPAARYPQAARTSRTASAADPAAMAPGTLHPPAG